MERIEVGEVTAKKKSLVYVKIVKNDMCNTCKACAFGRKNTLVVPALSETECGVGDRVSLRMPTEQVKGSYVYLYLLPLLFLFAGLMIGMPFGEKTMFIASLVGLAVSVPVVYGIERLFRRQKKYLPVVLNKIDCEEEENAND